LIYGIIMKISDQNQAGIELLLVDLLYNDKS